MHFYIEHNFGHHLKVGTPDDGATAKYNQNVYSFWITSVTKQYIDAWKKAFPSQLGDQATHDQIRDLANSYDAESLDKVLQNVNSKFFEILQVYRENADGDEWSAELSDSQNQEGYDAILRNSLTGETVKINYKYTSDFIQYFICLCWTRVCMVSRVALIHTNTSAVSGFYSNGYIFWWQNNLIQRA